MTGTSRSRLVVSLLLLAALVLAGCAGGAKPADTPSTEAPAAPAAPAPAPAETAPAPAPPDGPPATVRIGVVTFLSGGAAAPFGVPSRNAAEVLIERLNAGTAPAPYDTVGIGGVPIEAVYIDEAGGAEKQVAELRRLVLDEKVDLVIGYISSSDCLAVAPVAEELKKLSVLFDCGTNQTFEESSYKYVFRTSGHQVLDGIGAARYVLAQKPDLKTIAGINQDYAWGHDSWNAFKNAILQLKPDVKVVGELFPKLFASEYSAEISSLLSSRPDVVHTSFWGGDLESFVIQSSARGLQEQSLVVLTPGDTVLPRLAADVPKGVVIGARGPHGALAPQSALDGWFKQIYRDRHNIRPVYPSYHMSQAIFGAKAAYEKAMAANGGKWPTQDQVIAAFAGLEFQTPSGTIKMALGNGHQAVEPAVYAVAGDVNRATGEREMTQVREFPAECVNPPEGAKSGDWIGGGFAGSNCP